MRQLPRVWHLKCSEWSQWARRLKAPSRALLLFLCLAVAATPLPSRAPIHAQGNTVRLSLSGITVTEPDAGGNIEVSGQVMVTDRGSDDAYRCPADVQWCGLKVVARFRSGGAWRVLPDSHDCERDCLVKDDHCLTLEQVLAGLGLSDDYAQRDILWTYPNLQPGDEVEAFPFRKEISLPGRGFNHVRVVAHLVLSYGSCAPVDGVLPTGASWWPNNQRSFWAVSREFDLPMVQPQLTVSLHYRPEKPTRHDTVEFVATVSNASSDPLEYEWHVKEENDIERRVPAQTSEVYRMKLFPGSYTVSVKVSDRSGGTAKDSVPVTVGKGNRPPTVKLVSRPAYPVAGDTITVEALGRDPDGDALEYRFFDVGNGKEVGTLSPDPTATLGHLAKAMTAYKIMVIAYDGRGGTARAHLNISIGEETHVDSFIESGQVKLNEVLIPVLTERELSEGDVIETSGSASGLSSGRASIKYTDGTQVRVRSGTRLQMGSKGGFISLEKGALHSSIPSSAKNVAPVITTPSAIGTVEGTEFEVSVEDDGTTIFRVFDGSVDVSDLDLTKTVSVEPGEATLCEPAGVPSDPEPFDASLLDRWWESFPQNLTTEDTNKGDGNGDGRCTEVDALMALQMAVGLRVPDVANMDVNGDDMVSEVDALQILKWAVAGGQCAGVGSEPPKETATIRRAEPNATGPEDLPGASSALVEAARGGTITTASGMSLEIPAGALPSDTEVAVIPVGIGDPASGFIGGVRFEPDGTLLHRPAIIRLPLPEDWDDTDFAEIYEFEGRDPFWAMPSGRFAVVEGSQGTYVAKAEVLGFSGKTIAYNCHAGTFKRVMANFEGRGCDREAVIDELNSAYDKKLKFSDKGGCTSLGPYHMQAFLHTYFDVYGFWDSEDVPQDKLDEILEYAREGRQVVLAFASLPWKGRPPNQLGFGFKVKNPDEHMPVGFMHTATLTAVKDGERRGEVDIINTTLRQRYEVEPYPPYRLRLDPKTNKPIPLDPPDSLVSLYGGKEIRWRYPAKKLNSFRKFKRAEGLERALGLQPGALADKSKNPYQIDPYLPLEDRPTPWPYVLVYVEKAGGPAGSAWEHENPLCKKSTFAEFSPSDCPLPPCNLRLALRDANVGSATVSEFYDEVGASPPADLEDRPLAGLFCEYKRRIDGEWEHEIVGGGAAVVALRTDSTQAARSLFPDWSTRMREELIKQLEAEGVPVQEFNWRSSKDALIGDLYKKVGYAEFYGIGGTFRLNACVLHVNAAHLAWDKADAMCVFDALKRDLENLCSK